MLWTLEECTRKSDIIMLNPCNMHYTVKEPYPETKDPMHACNTTFQKQTVSKAECKRVFLSSRQIFHPNMHQNCEQSEHATRWKLLISEYTEKQGTPSPSPKREKVNDPFNLTMVYQNAWIQDRATGHPVNPSHPLQCINISTNPSVKTVWQSVYGLQNSDHILSMAPCNTLIHTSVRCHKWTWRLLQMALL